MKNPNEITATELLMRYNENVKQFALERGLTLSDAENQYADLMKQRLLLRRIRKQSAKQKESRIDKKFDSDYDGFMDVMING